ncbi:hypothetical protein VCHA53O466_40416 [Vibrio chagasii]|nr:hypothetical protein VCHA53O466_40416 [Vibrio chagasii]
MKSSNIAMSSLMMLISEKGVTPEAAVEIMQEINKKCEKIISGIAFKSDNDKEIFGHLLSKWLIMSGEQVQDESLNTLMTDLHGVDSSSYTAIAVCSLAGITTLVNSFLLSLFASGAIDEAEHEGLVELLGDLLKDASIELFEEFSMGISDSEKYILIHMLEVSFRQNISRYLTTVLEQGLTEHFLGSPATVVAPLKIQTRKEIELSLRLANEIIKN